jgi:hypothetical protein
MMSENHHIFRQKHQIKIFSYHGFYLKTITMNFVYLDRGQIYDHKRHDHELRLPGKMTDLWLWPSFTWTDLWPLFIQFYSRDSQYHKMKYFPMMINIIYQFCFQDSENYLREICPLSRSTTFMVIDLSSVQVNEVHGHKSVLCPGKRSSWSYIW